jgi:hypothetical protein
MVSNDHFGIVIAECFAISAVPFSGQHGASAGAIDSHRLRGSQFPLPYVPFPPTESLKASSTMA